MNDISPELVERMVDLMRAMGKGHILTSTAFAEARNIAALLPEPIDPDMVEARELFIETEGGIDASPDVVSDVRRGAADQADEIRLLLKGIKRGRELAESGK